MQREVEVWAGTSSSSTTSSTSTPFPIHERLALVEMELERKWAAADALHQQGLLAASKTHTNQPTEPHPAHKPHPAPPPPELRFLAETLGVSGVLPPVDRIPRHKIARSAVSNLGEADGDRRELLLCILQACCDGREEVGINRLRRLLFSQMLADDSDEDDDGSTLPQLLSDYAHTISEIFEEHNNDATTLVSLLKRRSAALHNALLRAEESSPASYLLLHEAFVVHPEGGGCCSPVHTHRMKAAELEARIDLCTVGCGHSEAARDDVCRFLLSTEEARSWDNAVARGTDFVSIFRVNFLQSLKEGETIHNPCMLHDGFTFQGEPRHGGLVNPEVWECSMQVHGVIVCCAAIASFVAEPCVERLVESHESHEESEIYSWTACYLLQQFKHGDVNFFVERHKFDGTLKEIVALSQRTVFSLEKSLAYSRQPDHLWQDDVVLPAIHDIAALLRTLAMPLLAAVVRSCLRIDADAVYPPYPLHPAQRRGHLTRYLSEARSTDTFLPPRGVRCGVETHDVVAPNTTGLVAMFRNEWVRAGTVPERVWDDVDIVVRTAPHFVATQRTRTTTPFDDFLTICANGTPETHHAIYRTLLSVVTEAARHEALWDTFMKGLSSRNEQSFVECNTIDYDDSFAFNADANLGFSAVYPEESPRLSPRPGLSPRSPRSRLGSVYSMHSAIQTHRSSIRDPTASIVALLEHIRSRTREDHVVSESSFLKSFVQRSGVDEKKRAASVSVSAQIQREVSNRNLRRQRQGSRSVSICGSSALPASPRSALPGSPGSPITSPRKHRGSTFGFGSMMGMTRKKSELAIRTTTLCPHDAYIAAYPKASVVYTQIKDIIGMGGSMKSATTEVLHSALSGLEDGVDPAVCEGENGEDEDASLTALLCAVLLEVSAAGEFGSEVRSFFVAHKTTLSLTIPRLGGGFYATQIEEALVETLATLSVRTANGGRQRKERSAAEVIQRGCRCHFARNVRKRLEAKDGVLCTLFATLPHSEPNNLNDFPEKNLTFALILRDLHTAAIPQRLKSADMKRSDEHASSIERSVLQRDVTYGAPLGVHIVEKRAVSDAFDEVTKIAPKTKRVAEVLCTLLLEQLRGATSAALRAEVEERLLAAVVPILGGLDGCCGVLGAQVAVVCARGAFRAGDVPGAERMVTEAARLVGEGGGGGGGGGDVASLHNEIKTLQEACAAMTDAAHYTAAAEKRVAKGNVTHMVAAV